MARISFGDIRNARHHWLVFSPNHLFHRLSKMKSFNPIDAIRHPLWWLMLVVLVVNDFVLKGSGLLPSIITGKLSDFAGLMVFPLLLAILIP